MKILTLGGHMKVVGLITEYNPFHNGHKFHLEKSKKLSGASHTIAVMSGNFLQRGEPALLDKWERAKIAIKEGVDLVIELPIVFSCNSAEFFAYGSLRLLNSLNIVDYICFGSEHGEIKELDIVSEILTNEPLEFKNSLKAWLDKGLTFPIARQRALNEYLDKDFADTSILNSPNNILAVEYLKALKLLKSRISPLTFKRFKADYNSTEIKGEICSATAIRNLLMKDWKDLNILKTVVPSNSYEIIKNAIEEGKGPVFAKDLEQIIFYKLRSIPINDLKNIHDINEGLENRLKRGAMISTTYSDLIEFLKTKRYTRTRLQRIIIKTIIGITKDDVTASLKKKEPEYIRVLGFTDKGADLLKRIKNSTSIPIITNLKRYTPQEELGKRMVELDTMGTDIYALLYKNSNLATGGLDYIKGPFIKK